MDNTENTERKTHIGAGLTGLTPESRWVYNYRHIEGKGVFE